MKEKIIYMPWIAAKLRNLGFKLLRTAAHPRKPQYDIYYFENTPELLKVLSEIKEGLQICQYQIRK